MNTEEIIKTLTAKLDRLCYHYNGTRWHDIGTAGIFKAALEQLLETYTVNVQPQITKVKTSSSGTPGNIANSSTVWTIEMTTGTDKIIFDGDWWQNGGASVYLNRKKFLSAYKEWDTWKLQIYDKGSDELTSFIMKHSSNTSMPKMKKFRIPVIKTCYGCVEIEAENLEKAIEKAYSLDDSYHVNKSDVTVIKEEIQEI